MPDAGRAFNRQVGTHEDRLETLEQQLAALGDVSTTKTTKEQKLAAVLHFATNKRGTQSETVAVAADEIQGCVGISRRYAYDLIEKAADMCPGVRVREARDVQTSTGVEHKKKALLDKDGSLRVVTGQQSDHCSGPHFVYPSLWERWSGVREMVVTSSWLILSAVIT